MILLHKKIMHKTGSAKRRAKKYYIDQYKKTGIIPKPLWLAADGIMEGRKCSGRSRALSPDIKNRFIQMVEKHGPSPLIINFCKKNFKKTSPSMPCVVWCGSRI
jgi:hypothetical protein